MQHKVTAQIGSTQISIETGKIAKLADGAVIVSCGDTIVLVSAVSATTDQGRSGLVPAHRRLPRKSGGGRQISRRLFQTRRSPVRKGNAHLAHDRSSAASALSRRVIFTTPRSSRILLSADGENDPDILAINGASAALCVSDIPFAGPIGAVRVGRVNGQFIANPTHDRARARAISISFTSARRTTSS